MPAFGSQRANVEAEYQSFLAHATIRRDLKIEEVDEQLIDQVLSNSEDAFSRIRVEVKEDFLNPEKIRKIIQNLNMDATPGYPLCCSYPTIGDLLGVVNFVPSLDRIELLLQQFYCWLSKPVCYPFRIFIKDEPHKQSKIDVGRWRLIFGSNVYLQILEHILYDDMDGLEALCQWDLPTKNHWHPFWGGGMMCRATFDDPVSMDKTCWDWTASSLLLRLDHQFRKNLVVGPEKWFDLHELAYNLSFVNCKFIFSSGIILRQRFEGLMKSGLVKTLSTNGHCQWFIHQLAQLKCGHKYKFWCLGDDVIMSRPCGEYLKRTLGFCLIS